MMHLAELHCSKTADSCTAVVAAATEPTTGGVACMRMRSCVQDRPPAEVGEQVRHTAAHMCKLRRGRFSALTVRDCVTDHVQHQNIKGHGEMPDANPMQRLQAITRYARL